MKKNVLVFPCGTEIGLEIYKSLSFSVHINLIGGSSVDDHGRYVYANYVGDLPYVDEPDFVARLNAVIEQYQIDFIFPAHDSVVLKLAQARYSGELSADVITSPVETCEIARSKAATYGFFEGIIPVPTLYDKDSILESELPVFLKPDVGQGSKGTYLARSLDDIAFYCSKDPSLLLLQYLPGREFTIDCFTNRHGRLLVSQARERSRIANGISVSSRTVDDSRFSDLADRINSRLKFRGGWFFQVKEDEAGELVLMEVAPRIAGTMGLIRCRGVNLPLLSLFDAMGVDVDIIENDYDLVIDRALQNRYSHDYAYNHVYLDFDDSVIFDGKINPYVMAFVYQCINKGIAVHLLTKHAQDLDATLSRYRLGLVFDEILWLRNGESKHSFIKHKDAIFIDDSYAERKSVHEHCGIPTFDCHMLESLLETA